MNDIKQNIREAEWTLTEKPILSSSVELIRILADTQSTDLDVPQPRRLSHAIHEILTGVSVPIEPHDRLAGRCVNRLLSAEEEQLFVRFCETRGQSPFFGGGHCTLNWADAAREGLPGLRARAETALRKQKDPEKQIFLQSALEIYDAISAFILRYAQAAEAAGQSEMAQNLRDALGVPQTFCGMLQWLWIITLIYCSYVTINPTLTLGRLDQILYPLYQKDIREGRLTRTQAAEYITDYYCKHNLIMGRGEHQVSDREKSTGFNRNFAYDSPQYLLLAGTDEQGRPAVNELTQLFTECICPGFKNPVIVVRYFKGMDTLYTELWKTLMEKAMDSASLMFYNDDLIINAYLKMGLPEADARKYGHVGCNWATPGDNGAWMWCSANSIRLGAYRSEEEKQRLNVPFMRMNSEHGWPEDFVEVLRELSQKSPDSVTIEDFYARFFARMEDFTERKLAVMSRELEARQRRPAGGMTFDDCFYPDSIEKAECYSAGAKYHFDMLPFQMFGTVADCFITVDQLVFIQKKVTLNELLEAVEHNFEGYEHILALCRKVEKYGSDTLHSNMHTKRLSEAHSRLVYEKSRPYFERQRLFLNPCIQSDTWHLKKGEVYGATPNGRLAGEAFSQNCGPSNGACTKGLTGMLNAMLNLQQGGLVSGALNLDIDSNQFHGEGGRRLLGVLLGTYFNQGGLHAQVSCLKKEDLLDARQNPEQHRDLRVRVTGYSGVYVDLSDRLQEDILHRIDGAAK